MSMDLFVADGWADDDTMIDGQFVCATMQPSKQGMALAVDVERGTTNLCRRILSDRHTFGFDDAIRHKLPQGSGWQTWVWRIVWRQ